jgi:hypothetical protein
MKTRHICIALAAVAVAGLWFGRLAWRAHHNLVTLQGRNMPLSDVVRALQRQTWERIRFDKSMSAKITLNVKDAPLSAVLDLVADRAGARWQKTYAVGASDGGMAKLEAVLDGAAKLAEAGWTNLAPRFSDLALENPPDPIIISQSSFGGGAAPEHIEGKPGMILHRALLPGGISPSGKTGEAGGGAKMVTIGPDGTMDQWSSERLVMESSLLSLLGSQLPEEATPKTAAQTASAVHGPSRLFYALEKSPFAMGHMSGGGGARPGPRKPGLAHFAPGDAFANMKQMLQQRRLQELSRSPEEQVERAHQHGDTNMRMGSYQQSN